MDRRGRVVVRLDPVELIFEKLREGQRLALDRAKQLQAMHHAEVAQPVVVELKIDADKGGEVAGQGLHPLDDQAELIVVERRCLGSADNLLDLLQQVADVARRLDRHLRAGLPQNMAQVGLFTAMAAAAH